jgi:hypothetical protein
MLCLLFEYVYNCSKLTRKIYKCSCSLFWIFPGLATQLRYQLYTSLPVLSDIQVSLTNYIFQEIFLRCIMFFVTVVNLFLLIHCAMILLMDRHILWFDVFVTIVDLRLPLHNHSPNWSFTFWIVNLCEVALCISIL